MSLKTVHVTHVGDEEFHHAFSVACYALRGYDYPGCLSGVVATSDFFDGPGADVGKMTHLFRAQYNRMSQVWPADVVAECLTHQWWDHLAEMGHPLWLRWQPKEVK